MLEMVVILDRFEQNKDATIIHVKPPIQEQIPKEGMKVLGDAITNEDLSILQGFIDQDSVVFLRFNFSGVLKEIESLSSSEVGSKVIRIRQVG